MLNKFRGRDGNFERLITSIGDAIGNPDLLANPPTTTNTLVSQGDIEDGKDTFTNEEKKCHALFRVSDYQWFKDRIEDRLPNTCLWFTNHPRYKAWLESQEGVLLVTADPGCGKSVLAKSLVEDELPRTSTVCYFFFKEMDQNNLALALCGLLHQLLLKRPDLIKHALRDYQANGDGMIKSVTVLWDILANACSDMRAGPIICVIDALDECLEDHMHDLSRKIDGFYRGRPGGQRNLKFLLTARPYESVTARFRILETMFPTICLRGEDESKTIGQEINIVIEHRVNKIATEKRLPPAIHQHLYNCLVAIPHRTYLWVYLVFDYIQTNIVKKTIGGIDAVIQRLPETVEAAYARLLDRCQLDARPEVRRALLVIVGAYRPLDLSEFNVAVSMVLKSSRWDEIDLEEDGEFRLRIRDWCGLFVSIYDNKAYLIHQTARDFLLAPIASTTLSPRWLHPFNIDSAMAMLAEICLAFLNLSDLSGEEKSCRNNSFTDLVSAGKPLAGYAPRYWLKHIRAVEHRSSTLHDLYDKILRNSSEFGPFWLENWLSANDNGIPLHDQQNLCKVRWTKSALKAFLGDDQGLTSELPRCVPAQKTAAELISPLFASVVGGQVATAMLLLASGADPNDTSFRDDSYLHVSLLHWISSFDYKKHDRSAAEYATVFERLVASGADIHCRHTRGLSKVTLLHSVADPELVPVICKLGADVEARDNFGRTPLHSQTGNPEVIRALLEQGANAQAVDQNGGTPLHQRGSLPQAIALLVNAGCPINAEDYCGSVALHSANSDCAEALLSLGADANWRKEDSLTPLHSVRDSETIKVLLRHGAVVDARDKTLRTPLMYSGQHLLLGKAEQLLGAGADPCVTDQNKATALHHACDAAEVYDEYEYDISKLGDILATAGVGLIELLITAGADVDAQDELGNTPLHVLCQKDGRIAKMEDVLPSVAILVTKGARTSIRNKEGKTPGDIAFDVYGQQRNFAGHFEALICHSETNEEGSRGRVTYEPPTKDGPQESVDDLLSRMEQTRLTYKDAFRRPPKLV
jgi:ankyrin repeat protein